MAGLIRIYSHHFVVTGFNTIPGRTIQRFVLPLVQYERSVDRNNQVHHKPARIFAASNAARTEYRFNIHCLDDFRTYLKDHKLIGDFVEQIEPLYEPLGVDFEMKDGMVAKDTQLPIIDYLTTRPDLKAKLVTLQTGQGKTFSFLKALSILGIRGVMVMRPKYIESWLNALYGKDRVTKLEPTEISVVQGSAQLMALIRDGQEGLLEEKLIIISNKTLLNYIKHYEDEGTTEEVYGCNPVDLWQTIGAGVVGRDEGHLDFHFNFKLDCYMHAPMTITLSATFDAEDSFLNKMQTIQFPLASRAPKVELIKICDVIGISYTLRYPTKLKFQLGGRRDYNHMKFEESILRCRKNTGKWLNIIEQIVDIEYVRKRQPGQRYIVFVSRVDMADAVVCRLRDCYPVLGIVRFAQGDPLTDALEADITVTTVMSGSTAIDIPGLTGGLLTTAIGSKDTNIQLLGRIREPKAWPGLRPRFVYLWCDSISSSRAYHQQKLEYFRGRVLSHTTQNSGLVLQ
jgi:hypothetical protein